MVAMFECDIEYQFGSGSVRDTTLNIFGSGVVLCGASAVLLTVWTALRAGVSRSSSCV